MIVKHQIPHHDDEPSDEMIEFLNDMKQKWEGDECGIIIYDGDKIYAGYEGDFVCAENGKYWIENANGEHLA